MKKTVFISSTYSDLSKERKAVWNLLEDFEVNLRGMEEFGARTESPLDTCLAEVDLSDIYIGIIAMRLGSIEHRTGKSFTQLEYERAIQHNKEILIYLIDEDNSKISPKNVDYGHERELLNTFKDLLRERHTIDYFSSSSDLAEKLRRDFARLLESKEQPLQELEDEYNTSKVVIDKFLLVPKHLSGREILLSVEYIGSPYPASRDICKLFNLEFGATIGVKVNINEPKGFSDLGLEELYIDANQIDELEPIQKGEKKEIYARLQFSENDVSNIKAHFKKEVFYTPSQMDRLLESVQSLSDVMATTALLGERIEYESEGKIVLVFSKTA